MTEVGVRQLKARLSEHLRRAQSGERLLVTDRGTPIATLGPVGDEALVPPGSSNSPPKAGCGWDTGDGPSGCTHAPP